MQTVQKEIKTTMAYCEDHTKTETGLTIVNSADCKNCNGNNYGILCRLYKNHNMDDCVILGILYKTAIGTTMECCAECIKTAREITRVNNTDCTQISTRTIMTNTITGMLEWLNVVQIVQKP